MTYDAEHAAGPAHDLPADDPVSHLAERHGLEPNAYVADPPAWHADRHPGPVTVERPDGSIVAELHTAATPMVASGAVGYPRAGFGAQHREPDATLSIPPDWKVAPPKLADDDPSEQDRESYTDEQDRDTYHPPAQDQQLPTDPGLRRAALNAQRPVLPDTRSEDTTPPPNRRPRLGATVLYRSLTGTYTMPAIISAVVGSLYPPNVEAGHVAPLSSDSHVHLAVMTCGIPGQVSQRTLEQQPELAAPDRPNIPAGGTFAEWDIPFWDPFTATGDGQLDAWLDGDLAAQPAGTWTWPVNP